MSSQISQNIVLIRIAQLQQTAELKVSYTAVYNSAI